jgi:hypothetical protein
MTWGASLQARARSGTLPTAGGIDGNRPQIACDRPLKIELLDRATADNDWPRSACRSADLPSKDVRWRCSGCAIVWLDLPAVRAESRRPTSMKTPISVP